MQVDVAMRMKQTVREANQLLAAGNYSEADRKLTFVLDSAQNSIDLLLKRYSLSFNNNTVYRET